MVKDREEFISDFKSEMKVGFLLANESLQNLKQRHEFGLVGGTNVSQKISNDNEHHKLQTLLLRFGELKKKMMYYLYNIDVNNSDFTLNEIHEVMVEILDYYSNTDVVILGENLSTQQKDIFAKDNGYMNLCKKIQEYYSYAQNWFKHLKTKLSEYD